MDVKKRVRKGGDEVSEQSTDTVEMPNIDPTEPNEQTELRDIALKGE